MVEQRNMGGRPSTSSGFGDVKSATTNVCSADTTTTRTEQQ